MGVSCRRLVLHRRLGAKAAAASQVTGLVSGPADGPLLLVPPVPTMVEVAAPVSAPVSPSHHENAHRRLVLHAVGNILEPTVEPP